MEILYFLYEKSERIGLTLFFVSVYLFLKSYAKYHPNLTNNSQDVIALTFIEFAPVASEIIGYMAVTAFLVYLARLVLNRISL